MDILQSSEISLLGTGRQFGSNKLIKFLDRFGRFLRRGADPSCQLSVRFIKVRSRTGRSGPGPPWSTLSSCATRPGPPEATPDALSTNSTF